jgi:hypothetical protein
MEIKSGYFELQRNLKNSASVSEVSSIPVEERKKILQNAQLIYPYVVNWVKDFPAILPLRLPSVCFSSSSTIGIDMQPAEGTQLSALSLVIFAIDDIADGAIGSYADEQIEDLLTLYVNIINSGSESYHSYLHLLEKFTVIDDSQTWAQVANALARCCREIKAFPSASVYYPFYAKHFCLCIEAMRAELHWRQAFERTKAYPSYEEYLIAGQKSIGLPTVVSGLLVMTNSPPVTPIFDNSHFDNLESLLDAVVLTYGNAVRLQNDIRSFERENIEQKPNTISILMLANKLTEKEAEAIVLKEIDIYLEKADVLLPLLPESLQPWGRCARRLSWFAKSFYLSREFHNFSLEMLSELARSN